MDTLFVRADLAPDGKVSILRRQADGFPWRRVVEPHATLELDEFAPEMDPRQRQEIEAVWAEIPIPSPPSLPIPLTPEEIYAEKEKEAEILLSTPIYQGILEAVAELQEKKQRHLVRLDLPELAMLAKEKVAQRLKGA